MATLLINILDSKVVNNNKKQNLGIESWKRHSIFCVSGCNLEKTRTQPEISPRGPSLIKRTAVLVIPSYLGVYTERADFVPLSLKKKKRECQFVGIGLVSFRGEKLSAHAHKTVSWYIFFFRIFDEHPVLFLVLDFSRSCRGNFVRLDQRAVGKREYISDK